MISWRLADIESMRKNGLTVFSCFCCGGGSSMGYKLAGFNVLGGCEIDPDMADLYEANLHPKMMFRLPIQEFRKKQHLEGLGVNTKQLLYNLDVLDGSPPCSVFSMSGKREDDWGKERAFTEGQAKQRLDDLFFHFIALAKELRPKLIVAENVKGLISGNARGYVKDIFDAFEEAGYDAQLFLLNSARMGTPQKRERVFFIARRKDLRIPALSLKFDDDPIPCSAALKDVPAGKPILDTKSAVTLWHRTPAGGSLSKAHPNGSYFNWRKLHPGEPSPTIAANCRLMHWKDPRCLTPAEIARLQTFPDDYDFGKSKAEYVCGMSVPPLMMKRLAAELAQTLSKTRT